MWPHKFIWVHHTVLRTELYQILGSSGRLCAPPGSNRGWLCIRWSVILVGPPDTVGGQSEKHVRLVCADESRHSH